MQCEEFALNTGKVSNSATGNPENSNMGNPEGSGNPSDGSGKPEDEEEVVRDTKLLGALSKMRNVARIVHLFDPGNTAVDKTHDRPRKKKKLSERWEPFVKRENLRKREAAAAAKRGESPRNSFRRRALNKVDLSDRMRRHSRKSSMDSMKSFRSCDSPIPRVTPTPDTRMDSPAPEPELTMDSPALVDIPLPASPDTSPSTEQTVHVEPVDTPPQKDDSNLRNLEDELRNIQDLLSSLKNRNSASKQKIAAYKNADYDLSGVYARARTVRREQEDQLWGLMHGPASRQTSTLRDQERSFLDELNEAGDSFDSIGTDMSLAGELSGLWEM